MGALLFWIGIGCYVLTWAVWRVWHTRQVDLLSAAWAGCWAASSVLDHSVLPAMFFAAPTAFFVHQWASGEGLQEWRRLLARVRERRRARG